MSKDPLHDILQSFDNLYEGFYTWLAGQFEPVSGGFFYARSSRASAEFQPDIESTGQAISILQRSDLIKSMPQSMRVKLINFFQQRQVPEGFFYDPHNKMREVDRMVARAVNYSSTSLEGLGTKPLYALPGTNGMDSLPSYMRSLVGFRDWMDQRPWDYAWMACDNISATSIYIKNLPAVERNAFLELIWSYLAELQAPDTGMWGGGRPYIKISGAFKLALFYRAFQKELPRAERIYQSILNTLREDVSEDMCWTRNPMDLLLALKAQLGQYPEEDVLEILTITYNNLQKYLKPDGGFSRHVEHSLEIPNNVPLGKGLIEGDMNAGTQALLIRSLSHKIIAEEARPLKQYTAGFYDKVSGSK